MNGELPLPTRLRTPKHFLMVPHERALTALPSGVYEYKRVYLNRLLPALGSLDLWSYYYLRIACCGALLVTGADKLRDCHVCHDNRGFICPRCLGATWVKYPHDHGAGLLRCTGCTVDSLDEKGKLQSHYDADQELHTVTAWLAHRFPLGVGVPTSTADLERFDAPTMGGYEDYNYDER